VVGSDNALYCTGANEWVRHEQGFCTAARRMKSTVVYCNTVSRLPEEDALSFATLQYVTALGWAGLS
jgi:hypothetical protein